MEILNPQKLQDLNEKEPIYTKIIIAGGVNVGKTLFMKRINIIKKGEKFNIENFDKNYISTIKRDFTKFDFEIKDKLYKVQFWDVSGQDIWEDTVYYISRGAGAILLFYDSCNRDSFLKAKKLYTNLYKSYPKSIYALVRSKYDLALKEENNDIVSDEEALEFANNNNIIFAHLSNFEKYETGTNELLREIFSKYLESSQI